jgi:hypothetical protein
VGVSENEQQHDPPLEQKVDLSVEPEHMLAIRNGVRQQLVDKVHALRMAARLQHRFGTPDRARKLENEARDTISMIAALDDPMSDPDKPQPWVDLPTIDTEAD